jgi:phosphate acetyltransferase
MKRIFAMVPAGHQVGLTSITLGLVRALQRKSYKVGFFKPIAQPVSRSRTGLDQSNLILQKFCNIDSPNPIDMDEAESLLRKGEEQVLMEKVAELYHKASSSVDIMIVEGMVGAHNVFFAKRLNQLIIETLDAEVILVSAAHQKTPEELAEAVEIQAREYSNDAESSVLGCVINKIGKPVTEWHSGSFLPPTCATNHHIVLDESRMAKKLLEYRLAAKKSNMAVLGTVPYMGQMIMPRLRDFTRAIDAHPIREGDWTERRVSSIALMSNSIIKSLSNFQNGALIVCSGDRADILIASALAELNGVKLGGLLLCGGFEPDPQVLTMMEPALANGLPMIGISKDIYSVSVMISEVNPEIPLDDKELALKQMDAVADHFEEKWLVNILNQKREHRTSPAAFRNYLIKMARKNVMRVVLPEGDEPRTVEAAIMCCERGIAKPILLARRSVVEKIAADLNLRLPADIEILDPDQIAENYVAPMVELRKSKGLTAEEARELLKDPIYIGTMMLKLGEADGLVSGAVHTSANTVKPALQLIKCVPGCDTVSSIFFMCLPNQVLIYGDCAIVQDPTAEQLASIAIQAAENAKAFHIPQRIAMVSYSTGNSGTGADVDKVRRATQLVRELRPDLCIDGPLQYDAAVIDSVAAKKAPNSPVAGRATILIFPDLNTGNITYKAVQRSAHVVSIGPMLQGLNKPVNDLSRGALVDDIIYTIALTGIQAQQTLDREKNVSIKEIVNYQPIA